MSLSRSFSCTILFCLFLSASTASCFYISDFSCSLLFFNYFRIVQLCPFFLITYPMFFPYCPVLSFFVHIVQYVHIVHKTRAIRLKFSILLMPGECMRLSLWRFYIMVFKTDWRVIYHFYHVCKAMFFIMFFRSISMLLRRGDSEGTSCLVQQSKWV